MQVRNFNGKTATIIAGENTIWMDNELGQICNLNFTKDGSGFDV